MIHKGKKSWIDIFRKEPDQAWQKFIDMYDDLIRKVIHRFCHDYDDRMELYVHTLDRLRDHDFQKLTCFYDKKRSYDFETWIAVVVRNCSMDWFRKEKGRNRLLKCIKELPQSDQFIFSCLYQRDYSPQAAFELLKASYGKQISEEDFCTRIEKINRILEDNSRWNLSGSWQKILPEISLESLENGQYKMTGKDPPGNNIPTPEQNILRKDSMKIIREIYQRLPSQDRIILHLHFYRNLTLQEISRIMKIKNIWQVHRRIHRAIKFLQQEFKKREIDSADLTSFEEHFRGH